MRVAIHQPAYLPWLGYIEKIKNCDVFVFLDSVQYSKNSFDNRNKIPLDGQDRWLTIPISTAGKSGQIYTKTQPANYKWIELHKGLIHRAYKNAPYFPVYWPLIQEMYAELESCVPHGGLSLADTCYSMLPFFMSTFKVIKSTTLRSSQLHLEKTKSELVLEICQLTGANEYYSGVFGHDYLDEEAFKKAGIKIIYQEYKPENNYAAIHQLFTKGPVL